MDTVFNAAIAISSGLYACLLIYVQIKRRQLRVGRLWLSTLVVFAALTDLLLIPQFESISPSFSHGFGLSALITTILAVYGYLVLKDIRDDTSPLPRIWFAISAIWLVVFLISWNCDSTHNRRRRRLDCSGHQTSHCFCVDIAGRVSDEQRHTHQCHSMVVLQCKPSRNC